MIETNLLARLKRFLPKREQDLVIKAFREEAVAEQGALVYGVNFDTRAHPGFIAVTRVRLDTVLIDDTETVRLDLRDTPLYAHLERYVNTNSDSRQRLIRAALDVRKDAGMDALLIPVSPDLCVAVGSKAQLHKLLSVATPGETP